MNEVFHFRACILAVALIVASTTVGGAQRGAPSLNLGRFLSLCPNAITQNFPTSGQVVTTWMICWREVAGTNSIADPNGLVIGPVYFRQSPSAPFVRILWDMRVSDYFVPYHDNSHRFRDLSLYNFTLTGLTGTDCPANVGAVLLSPHVCKEVRDRGLMWKDFTGARRGEELALWGALYAANYRYIQEYTFRDDGVIIGRQGATGRNYPGSETITHAHNALWRIDIDLGGVTNNAARLQHFELPPNDGMAVDTNTPIATAQGFTWSPRTHDVVEITNPSLKNAQGHDSAYELIPLVTGEGLTQHAESFTQNDFWVTPYNPAQFAATNLPSYVSGSSPVANRDIVVWYKGSDHHEPRDEDGVFGPSGWTGTAHTMLTGYMLMPHDFFDCSPFYKPCP